MCVLRKTERRKCKLQSDEMTCICKTCKYDAGNHCEVNTLYLCMSLCDDCGGMKNCHDWEGRE
jgi:hypothetical protein